MSDLKTGFFLLLKELFGDLDAIGEQNIVCFHGKGHDIDILKLGVGAHSHTGEFHIFKILLIEAPCGIDFRPVFHIVEIDLAGLAGELGLGSFRLLGRLGSYSLFGLDSGLGGHGDLGLGSLLGLSGFFTGFGSGCRAVQRLALFGFVIGHGCVREHADGQHAEDHYQCQNHRKRLFPNSSHSVIPPFPFGKQKLKKLHRDFGQYT